MNISFFFRKPSPTFHSIEEQFFMMQKELPELIKYENKFAKYQSKGLFKRIFITIQAAFNQGDINHITGDIHFVALFLKKKKTILTVHDIGSVLNKPGIKGKILRFFWFTMPFKRVKYITVISEFTKKEILQTFKVNPDKIVVIPDCVSPQISFSDYEFNTKQPNILQIGTKQNKNLECIISAIKDTPCKLTILGKLSEKQTALLEKNTIRFENQFNLDYPGVLDLYKKADMLVFASTYEGFGVPVLEAQATGRPVITSNISPMKEVAGEGALLVDPYSIDDIRNGIQQIISDPELRQSLIRKGRENLKNYSAKAVAEKYYELYKKTL